MKNNLKYILLILIFCIGILFERFQIDEKILNFSKKIIDGISRILYSFKNVNKINLIFKAKNMTKFWIQEKSVKIRNFKR